MSAFLDDERLAADVRLINEAARGRLLSVVGLAVSVMRNDDPFLAPSRFRITDLLQKLDAAHHARMAALYRQRVLKEAPLGDVLRIQGLRPRPAQPVAAAAETERAGVWSTGRWPARDTSRLRPSTGSP